jgi:hypothetical protein
MVILNIVVFGRFTTSAVNGGRTPATGFDGGLFGVIHHLSTSNPQGTDVIVTLHPVFVVAVVATASKKTISPSLAVVIVVTPSLAIQRALIVEKVTERSPESDHASRSHGRSGTA